MPASRALARMRTRSIVSRSSALSLTRRRARHQRAVHLPPFVRPPPLLSTRQRSPAARELTCQRRRSSCTAAQADETASPAAALTSSPRLPTPSIHAASAAAKSPAASALETPLTVDTEEAAVPPPPPSAPGAQCSSVAAAPAAAVTAVALCKADKPPPSPAAETASESDAADSDDDDDYDDDEDAEEALLRGSGYRSDGSSGGDSVSVLVPTTPGGRPFSSAFAMWADDQRRLGRDPRALLRVVCEDMDLEVDVDGMLAGDDDDGCGDDDDDDDGARPQRADTGGEDLNDVDDADVDDSGARGTGVLSDSGHAAGRGGDTFGARTNARTWRILQSLMMWRNKCLVAEKRVTRPKLTSINTLEDVAALLTRARNVIVLTGAGISVACGIPDFRSENGLYSMLGEYQLPSPQAMFDIAYFRTNPAPFFKFARELLPGSYTPSATHRFIKALQDRGKLLRNYTQNIDGLEREAGVLPEHLHQCHGSLDTARCLRCEHRVPLSDIEAEIRAQTIPMCKICNHPDGVVKPDIVFFGEPLGRRFMDLLTADRARCDAVLVMGSSLKVAPVNLIIGWMPRDVPLVLLNRETVGQPHAFDVELLGDCDAAVAALTRLLGWPADAGGGGGGGAAAADGACAAAAAAEADAAPQPEFELPSTYYFANGKRKADAFGGGGGGALSAEALLDLDAAAASYESTMERATRIHSPAHTDSPASSPLSHGGSSSIGGGGNAAAARRAASVGGSAGGDAAGRSAHF